MSTLFPVGSSANINLTNGQKELLLWHWHLGIGMSHIQEMMAPHRAVDPNGMTDMMPSVITPKFATAATCAHPKCTTLELSNACQHGPKDIRQQAIAEKEGILAVNKYHPGDFVSMDQYVCAGREPDQNCYHGITIFNNAASGAICIQGFGYHFVKGQIQRLAL